MKEILEILKENTTIYDCEIIHDMAASKIESLIKENYVEKEFVEWAGMYYIKVEGGWFHRYGSQNISNLKTTDELQEYWQTNIKDK